MPHDQSRYYAPAIFVTTMLALAGCATDAEPQMPASGICDVAAAQRLVGKAKPADAEAMRLTGSTIVRQISPGDPVTQDLRNNRVTIETDPATGRVVRATCG